MTNEELQNKIDKRLAQMKFYRLNSILGNANWGCMFYILIGPRACGKSYAVMEQFLKDWKKSGT
jgi:predicted AAA+ superfamily ATPase